MWSEQIKLWRIPMDNVVVIPYTGCRIAEELDDEWWMPLLLLLPILFHYYCWQQIQLILLIAWVCAALIRRTTCSCTRRWRACVTMRKPVQQVTATLALPTVTTTQSAPSLRSPHRRPLSQQVHHWLSHPRTLPRRHPSPARQSHRHLSRRLLK